MTLALVIGVWVLVALHLCLWLAVINLTRRMKALEDRCSSDEAASDEPSAPGDPRLLGRR